MSVQLVALQEAVIPFVAEDDVFEDLDAEGVARGLEFAGDFYIILTGGNISGGVVVGEDDAGVAVGDGIGKDLPGVKLGLVEIVRLIILWLSPVLLSPPSRATSPKGR